MSSRPMWLFECLDAEEAQLLLESAPDGSFIETVPKGAGELVILWVPIAPELVASLANGHKDI